VAEAQQPRVYRVGVLSVGSPNSPALKGLRDGLKEAGYIEGKNLFLDIPLNKTYDELHPLAKGWKEKKVDAIVTIGATATGIAKEATQETPIVFIYSTDPVRQGFVKSLARPETNLTGLSTFPDAELQGKRLEVFKEVVPALQRAVVMYNARADALHHAESLEVVRKVSPGVGVKLIEKPIKAPAEAEPALSTVSRDNADGIFMICSGLFRDVHGRIGASALQKKLPLMGCFEPMRAEYGGLLEYDTDRYRIGHRGGWYVGRILKGTKPQDLPVETPTKFELMINLKIAKQIGLTIPSNVLARADKVIR
jgi:putative ABC transport system substrate-binding protein